MEYNITIIRKFFYVHTYQLIYQTQKSKKTIVTSIQIQSQKLCELDSLFFSNYITFSRLRGAKMSLNLFKFNFNFVQTK